MTSYTAPVRDFKFLTDEVLDFYGHYQRYPHYQDVTPATLDMVLSECAKFCESEIAPLYRSGDEEGCNWVNGSVVTPTGFKEAYAQYIEGGWQGIAHPVEYGGTGLPPSVGLIRTELLGTANWSWSMYPALSLGAMDTLIRHGNEDQKKTYLKKLTEGVWSGTMCLTEAQCGSDLGLIRTQASHGAEGSYSITGTKIFISAGEHDLTENIIHIVLARLPDAPPGSRGISLFLVPKILVNHDGSLGRPNTVTCLSIEDKMGLKASSTAVLNFECAKGYLIGEPNKGLEYMFTYMNTARLGIAIQGVCSSEMAYQVSLPYAKERLAMRSLAGPKHPDKVADPIIVHPDVRRMLLSQKAFSEGGRAMICYTGKLLDHLEQEEDAERRQQIEEKLSFLTPILKGFLTEIGCESANLGLQTLGGHGYVKESGLEQIVRDSRIATIYEGTTGIQALDLLGRKIMREGGRSFRLFASEILGFCRKHSLLSRSAHKRKMHKFVWPLSKAVFKWYFCTLRIGAVSRKQREMIGCAAVDYLMYSGYVMMAYLWAMMAQTAIEALESRTETPDFYRAKLKTAEFFFERILPRTNTLSKTMTARPHSLLSIASEEF